MKWIVWKTLCKNETLKRDSKFQQFELQNFSQKLTKFANYLVQSKALHFVTEMVQDLSLSYKKYYRMFSNRWSWSKNCLRRIWQISQIAYSKMIWKERNQSVSNSIPLICLNCRVWSLYWWSLEIFSFPPPPEVILLFRQKIEI